VGDWATTKDLVKGGKGKAEDAFSQKRSSKGGAKGDNEKYKDHQREEENIRAMGYRAHIWGRKANQVRVTELPMGGSNEGYSK